MNATIRPRYALLTLFAATPAVAQPADPIAAIRADRWSDAQLAAAAYADPVALKLVRYFRLLAPGAATADEIAEFMAQSPDWPNQALLERRRQEAIAAEPGPGVGAGAMRAQPADPAAGHAALRPGAGERRKQRRGGRSGAQRVARRDHRCGCRGRLPAPLVRRHTPGGSMGALPAPCLARRGRCSAPDPAARSRASRQPPRRGSPCSATPPMPTRCFAALPAARRSRSGHDAGAGALAAASGPHRGGPGPVAERRGGGAAGRAARRNSRRSGPSATCSPVACCGTAMRPAPMRSPRITARSHPSRCWMRSSWRALSHCVG